MVDVEGAEFSFSAEWSAIKYDDSAFYRDIFSRVHDGLGAVDIVAVERDPDTGNDARVVLIEVKDYRHPTSKGQTPSALVEKVLRKVTSTLAGLSVCARRAEDSAEKSLAARTQAAVRVEVILHCENPANPIVDPSELAIKLRQRLQPLADFVSVGTQRSPSGPWTVLMPNVED